MTTAPLSLRDLNRATLARQMLLTRASVDVGGAVERLAGLQAQQARPPFVGLWTRMERFARADLLAAIHTSTVVRATLMRGTLHLVSAADYWPFRLAIHPMLVSMFAGFGPQARTLDTETVAAAGRRYLAKGPSDFQALRAHLVNAFADADAHQLGVLIRTHLPLIQPPTDGPWGYKTGGAFALAEDILGEPRTRTPAPGDLVLRYLAAFGPATPGDFTTWSGLRGARELFEALGDRLLPLRDEQGRTLYDLPDAPRPDGDAPAPIRFLPEYDNLLLSHDDRSRVIAREDFAPIYSKNGIIAATILVDGFVAGTWTIDAKQGVAILRVAPFRKLLVKHAKALEAEGRHLLRFLHPDAEDRRIELAKPA